MITIEPSGLSTWASDVTVKQIEHAREFKENLKYFFVVSRKILNTVIGKNIRDLAASIQIPILKTEIEQRVSFAESITMGESIFEWNPKSKAALSIEQLTKDIQQL